MSQMRNNTHGNTDSGCADESETHYLISVYCSTTYPRMTANRYSYNRPKETSS